MTLRTKSTCKTGKRKAGNPEANHTAIRILSLNTKKQRVFVEKIPDCREEKRYKTVGNCRNGSMDIALGSETREICRGNGQNSGCAFVKNDCKGEKK